MVTCTGCGATLKLLEYQSRSADEAHTSTNRCPNCPLVVHKFLRTLKNPHVYLADFRRSSNRVPRIDIHKESYTQTKVVQVYSPIPTNLDKSQYELATCYNVIVNESRLYKVYERGPWGQMAVQLESPTKITLNATISVVHSFHVPRSTSSTYQDFLYTPLSNNVFIILKNNMRILTMRLTEETDQHIIGFVNHAYRIGFMPTDLKSYVSKLTLGSILNISSRAYDVYNAADNENYFTSKPDGERMWLLKSGSVWFYCRRLIGLKVEYWYSASTVTLVDKQQVSIILDVEYMMNHPCILLDIVMFSNGVVSPYNRTVEWVMEHMKMIQLQEPHMPDIYVRPYFDTSLKAYEYCRSVSYPTDGIVAISKESMDMKKLKPFRSIELQVSTDGTLVTKEGIGLLRLTNKTEYEIDTIVEIRFTLTQGQMKILSHFHRPDKESANDSAAINSIIESCNSTDSGIPVRTSIWRWSNALRFYIYERAMSIGNDKTIVLDIGSGSGQSTEAFVKMKGCSFILVEPDTEKCRELSRRLGVRHIDSDPRSLIPNIISLKKGGRKYHILNTSLRTVLADKATMKNLAGILKCAIACFSMNFILPEVDELTSYGIRIIGCYYSYTGIDIGKYIINSGGVSMKKIESRRGEVKWGKDPPYTEPICPEEDMPITVSSVVATDAVSCTATDTNVIGACRDVRLVISF